MKRSTFSSLPDSPLPDQISRPILRLIRSLAPKDSTPPTSIAAVEAYKRKFLRHLEQQLSAASEIIHDALVADGRSEAAANAEVDRFANEVAGVVRSFRLESMSSTMGAEELDRAQAVLEGIHPPAAERWLRMIRAHTCPKCGSHARPAKWHG